MISFSGICQNSASASFTASVNIIEPISIETTSNMNFASIDARNGGSVILNPDHTRITTGDVRLENAASVSAAVFEVRGQNGHSYNISVPTGEFKMTNGTNEIVIKDFLTDFKAGSKNSDTQTISLGATLQIEPEQMPGHYTTSSPIEITVSYN
ncbi:DUF4402 domain-containing protein [Christiangramia forsetii]|nr:DUF4402 domain-containing protein [Christiangramia forsetii]GGG42051.1 hypothetical protein GCM10011532_27330 [Christiangramia forsetii]